MNVGELKKLLEQYPDDLEVIYEKFSDYQGMEEDEITLVSGVNKGYYFMRAHETMSEANKVNEEKALCFPGN